MERQQSAKLNNEFDSRYVIQQCTSTKMVNGAACKADVRLFDSDLVLQIYARVVNANWHSYKIESLDFCRFESDRGHQRFTEEWRNGSRNGLLNRRPNGCAGSSPVSSANSFRIPTALTNFTLNETKCVSCFALLV